MKPIFILLCLLLPILVWAQTTDEEKFRRRTYTTSIVSSVAPTIDGALNDDAWDGVEWGSNFIVQNPNNGDIPKKKSQFKILYDKNFLYIAFRAFDDPKNVVARMARRDNFPGDWMEINIDSYFDKNTAFSFTLSASGVKGDEFVTNNGQNWDGNWNPIWYTATQLDDLGWTGEAKIPLSQLRYGDKAEQVWGIQVQRRDFSNDERSTFQPVPTNASGWVSNFAEMQGIKGIKTQKQVEIQPFIFGAVKNYPAEEGNPFRDGRDAYGNVGVDGKIGLTSDLTLDFTINPDFGQVEADPSALNLNGFQIFFQERRPFFIENANLFGLQMTGSNVGDGFDLDNLFYSRRIGRRPSGQLRLPNGSYSSTPDFSSILGAAKVSGKNKDGWSMGLLESVTAEEKALLRIGDQDSSAVVEPLTNYFVSRLSKDLNNGATIIGGTLTSTNRFLDNTGLEDQYHRSAYSSGLNLLHTWKDREWQIKANFAYSQVNGTTSKITDTQSSFEHYYQRPDANHISVDTSRTSLAGHGGTLSLSNQGGADNISFQTGVTWRTPGFELNDIGFLNTADEINHFSFVGYQSPKAIGIFRQFNVNVSEKSTWSYGGEHNYLNFGLRGNASFSNYWSLGGGAIYEIKDISPKALFGGPRFRQASGVYNYMYINSDGRKKCQFNANLGMFNGVGDDKGTVTVRDYGVGMEWQPLNALSVNVYPSYFSMNRLVQNVGFSNYEGQSRYIAGSIRQEQWSMSIRGSYNLTPNLTVEYWGQPFISKGNYKDFKYITNPLAATFPERYVVYESSQIRFNGEDNIFLVDENKDGITDYNFEQPDFNFMQWRSNAVLRWEYIPGSELFVVWTQSTTNFGDPMQNIGPALYEGLFSQKGQNIFLVKCTYRFLRKAR